MAPRASQVSRRLVAALLLGAGSAWAQAPGPDSIQTLIKTSTFAFQGTVIKRGAVADSVLTPSDETILVQATTVLQCPHDIGNFEGQTLTVHAVPGHVPAEGTSPWFFATAWVIGDRIAVDALAMFEGLGPPESRQLSDAFDDAVWKRYMVLLLAARDRSDLFGAGTIQRVAEAQSGKKPEGEHSTTWYTLDVLMNDVYKGAGVAAGQLTRVFVPEAMVADDAGYPLAAGARRVFMVEQASRTPQLAGFDSQGAFFARDSMSVRLFVDLIDVAPPALVKRAAHDTSAFVPVRLQKPGRCK